MPRIDEIVTSADVVAYWIEKNLNTYTVGEQLFPTQKQIGIEIEWVKGAHGQPVALKLSAWDSKTTRRDRSGLEKYNTEMPFFKESMVIDEKTRQQLNTVLQTQNNIQIEAFIKKTFDDLINLIQAAYEAIEGMRMEVLTTGQLTLESNGQKYEYDYMMPEDNKVDASKKWSEADADPIKDINDIKKKARQNGYRIARAMCNSNVLEKLTNNSAIAKKIYVMTNGLVSITAEQVKTFIETQTGITIAVQDEGYVTEEGDFVPYFSDDLFVLFPEGPLGKTYFGTTPEESDLMTGSNANVSLVNEGIAVTTFKIEDPVNVETKVSMIALPSFDLADAVYIMDVEPQS